MGYVDGEPVATGAWRRTDVEALGSSRTAEVKRMYVAGARGAGHARAMLAHLEQTAAAGAEAMILETGLAQPEAIALYESSGYTPIPCFGHYRWPDSRCFGGACRSPERSSMTGAPSTPGLRASRPSGPGRPAHERGGLLGGEARSGRPAALDQDRRVRASRSTQRARASAGEGSAHST